MSGKLPEKDLAEFQDRLSAVLAQRFQGHWNPDKPDHGSAYRCILSTLEKMDPILRAAADSAFTQISAILPPSLSVWIDPFEVLF